jgi:GT2 family glycosyltransferase
VKSVAIAILNWNGIRFLKEFLPGVVSHSIEDADVYVIDNASSDDSISFIQSQFPEVKIIQLDKNYGFAGGYNHGLRAIPNDWVVLLNSDVEVTPNWIKPVMDYLATEPLMVACQPKILDYHRRDYFEYAGAAGGYIDKDGFAFCAGRIFYEFDKNDNEQFFENEEVFWASGAAMFIKRSAYFEVDGLDEDFFAHMEEIDLCWRLKNRGYKVGACRKSEVYHYGGGTLDRMNPYKTFLNFRNNLYLILKNYRAGNTGLKLFRRMLLDGIAGVRFLSEGNFSYFIAVLKAHFSFYGSFFKMLSKRKKEKRCDRNVNLSGMYNESIIKAFFLHKKHFYRQLNRSSFVK